jgi:hypothetical protein
MYCTPYLICGNVVFLAATCFYRSNLFERPCIYMLFLSLTIKKIAVSRVMLFFAVNIRIYVLWELILICISNIDDLLAIVK